ncbi:MAG TPA: hypothetical protein PL163_00885 [Leptospiraceae bacterium]|nr:hypothetical protein [Leptospiraceae bacterium]
MSNPKKIYLGKQKLKSIPEEIFEKTYITELNLNCNEISVIPESIGKLKNLKKLYLMGNPVTALPESMQELKKLEVLDLSGTQLKILPLFLFSMLHLKKISLWGTSLEYIPEEIGNLKGLTSLSVWTDRLPDSIGSLTDLVKLNLTGKNLNSLPSQIGNLISLESLFINHTNIENLPDSFGNLQNLKTADLSANSRLRDLPASLGKLKRLEKLNLLFCDLKFVPEEIGYLNSLKELQIQTASLPTSIGKLNSLEILVLSSLKSSELPKEIEYLIHLKTLKILDTQAEFIELDFGKFRNLNDLQISRNPNLKGISGSIGKSSLEQIYFNDNPMWKHLPEELGQCQNLEDIEMIYSHFEKLPASLSQLKSLKKLRFAWNENLKDLPFSEEQVMSLEYLDLTENPNLLVPSYFQKIPSRILSSSSKNFIMKLYPSIYSSKQEIADKMISELNDGIEHFEFPYWDDYSTYHSAAGKMRVSAFHSEEGMALIFESIEYNSGTGEIWDCAKGFATFSISRRMPNIENSIRAAMDGFKLERDMIYNLELNDEVFPISLETEFIEFCESRSGSSGDKPPDEAILLFKIAETVPVEKLFPDIREIRKAFEIPETMEHIYSVTDWLHPTADDIFGENKKMEEFESIVELINAAAEHRRPVLKEEPNTDWKQMFC